MSTSTGTKDREVRVAPCIYRSRHGWRVYVRRHGARRPKRFPATATLEELQLFVDTVKQETARLRRAAELTRLRDRRSVLLENIRDVERRAGMPAKDRGTKPSVTAQKSATLGENIERHRLSRGWTILELADKAGLAKSSVMEHRKDRERPGPGALKAYADLFGVGVFDLLPETGPKPDRDRTKAGPKRGSS